MFETDYFNSSYEAQKFATIGQKTISGFEMAALMPVLMPVNNKLILELGTGTGRIAMSVVACQGIVIGMDISRSALQGAKAKKVPSEKLFLLRGDAGNLPFIKGAFDKIYSTRMLQYVPSVNAVINETSRLIKPNGELVLEITNVYSWESFLRVTDKLRSSPPYRYNLLKLKNIQQVLELYGFEVCSVIPIRKIPEYVWIHCCKNDRTLRFMKILEKILIKFTPTQLFSSGIVIKCRTKR
jgi:ubiquinone/menaquinone biosynthesis C-methylase UbiE